MVYRSSLTLHSVEVEVEEKSVSGRPGDHFLETVQEADGRAG